jgi:FkbM family methyltransferase
MKLLHDWHIPDWDRHYENVILKYNNKWSYQQRQRDFALNKVKEWDIAIDIGANVGFWTKELCSKFRFVWAFEPGRENWECCHKNLEGVKNYQLEQVAISNIEAENVELYNTSSSCGDMRIKPIGKKARVIDYVDMVPLDSYYHELMPKYAGKVGLIKIDVQEHEKEVLLGAKKILEEHSPVICIELPTRDEKEKEYKVICKNILGNLGYREVDSFKKETIFIKD